MINKLSRSPYVLMALLLLLWGSYATVAKLVLEDIDGFLVQFYMFGFAFVIYSLILLVQGRFTELRKIPRREYIKLLLYSLPSFLYYFLYAMSLRLLPAIEASMLNYLFPVMIVIFSVPINGERVNARMVLSILSGLAGMLLIVSNGNIASIKVSNLKGDLLAISAAICWGLFSNLGKKNKVDNALSNYVFITGCFILSIITVALFSRFALPGFPSFAGAAWLGMSNIVIAYYIWFRALKIVPASLISCITFITPFVTLLFIMVFLGDRVTFAQIFGLMVIVLGIAIQVLTKKGSLQMEISPSTTSAFDIKYD